MTEDHVFRIGSSHEVCEDYALSGKSKECSYCIISDGCSSGKETDIVSRILSMSARSVVHSLEKTLSDIDSETMKRMIGQISKQATVLFGDHELAATLLFAVRTSEGFAYYIYGDGFLFFKPKDRPIHLIEYSFKNNMPYYIMYEMDENRKVSYVEHNGEDCLTETITVDGETVHTQLKPYDYTYKFRTGIITRDVEYVGVCSDGISTFYNKAENKTIPAYRVINDMMQFKSIAGKFLQRRSSRVMKEYATNGYINYDDISISVVINEEIFGGSSEHQGQSEESR